MRRALAMATVVLAVAGCAGRSPAEDAYLAEIQQEGSSVEVLDPDGEITKGDAVCSMLRNTKLKDREITVAILEQDQLASRITIIAALHHLCPNATEGTGY